MKILTVPSKILNEKSDPVEKFDKKLLSTIRQMEKTLDATVDPKGVGLSAPQVGIQKRFFIMRPTTKSKLHVFVNPEIVETKEIDIPGAKKLLEGCLSIPNIWGNVKRPNYVKIKYLDPQGKAQSQSFESFVAAVVQHEIDHLDGILFTQRVMEQNEQLFRSFKNNQGEDEFEEISL